MPSSRCSRPTRYRLRPMLRLPSRCTMMGVAGAISTALSTPPPDGSMRESVEGVMDNGPLNQEHDVDDPMVLTLDDEEPTTITTTPSTSQPSLIEGRHSKSTAANISLWTTSSMGRSARTVITYDGSRKASDCLQPKIISLSLLYLTTAGDGVFATSQHGHIALVDLKSNSTTNLVAMADVKDVSSYK